MKHARLSQLVFCGFFALGLLQCDIPDQKAVPASAPAPALPVAPPPPPLPPPAKNVKAPRTPGLPAIEYWQDATWDGGPALFRKILENVDDAGEFIALLLWLGVIDELGYDLYAVSVKFSNPNNHKIVVSPKQFRVGAGRGGQSYPLEVFLVPRNGDVEHWEKVIMPSRSSVELYGYYAAPKYFRGSTLSAR